MDTPTLIVVHVISFVIVTCMFFMVTMKHSIALLGLFAVFVYVAEIIPIFYDLNISNIAELTLDLTAVILEMILAAALFPLLFHWISKHTRGGHEPDLARLSRKEKMAGVGIGTSLFSLGLALTVTVPAPPGLAELPLSMGLFAVVLVFILRSKDLFFKFIGLNIAKMVLYPFIAMNLVNSFPLVIITMLVVNVSFIAIIIAGFQQHGSLMLVDWEAGKEDQPEAMPG